MKSGYEVTWNDPDDDKCTCTGIIKSIEYQDDMARIEWDDGRYLECYVNELS